MLGYPNYLKGSEMRSSVKVKPGAIKHPTSVVSLIPPPYESLR